MYRWALLLPLLALTGCKSILPSSTDCSQHQPFMDAREAPPLVVPEGLDAPNTRAALRIPDVRTPPRPDDGRCLEFPPRYRSAPAAQPTPPGG